MLTVATLYRFVGPLSDAETDWPGKPKAGCISTCRPSSAFHTSPPSLDITSRIDTWKIPGMSVSSHTSPVHVLPRPQPFPRSPPGPVRLPSYKELTAASQCDAEPRPPRARSSLFTSGLIHLPPLKVPEASESKRFFGAPSATPAAAAASSSASTSPHLPPIATSASTQQQQQPQRRTSPHSADDADDYPQVPPAKRRFLDLTEHCPVRPDRDAYYNGGKEGYGGNTKEGYRKSPPRAGSPYAGSLHSVDSAESDSHSRQHHARNNSNSSGQNTNTSGWPSVPLPGYPSPHSHSQFPSHPNANPNTPSSSSSAYPGARYPSPPTSTYTPGPNAPATLTLTAAQLEGYAQAPGGAGIHLGSAPHLALSNNALNPNSMNGSALYGADSSSHVAYNHLLTGSQLGGGGGGIGIGGGGIGGGNQPRLKFSHAKAGGRTKKQALSCFFCRERKIACGRPEEGKDGLGGGGNGEGSCNQCARRKIPCNYPTVSHRGQHSRIKSAARKGGGVLGGGPLGGAEYDARKEYEGQAQAQLGAQGRNDARGVEYERSERGGKAEYEGLRGGERGM
ncbi:hypothetical protein C8R44DRAFT_362779 [Mycena epipterygia]|nr:hypothetical protein C8R44DRAFT_362779 [Mycena epipterygia]